MNLGCICNRCVYIIYKLSTHTLTYIDRYTSVYLSIIYVSIYHWSIHFFYLYLGWDLNWREKYFIDMTWQLCVKRSVTPPWSRFLCFLGPATIPCTGRCTTQSSKRSIGAALLGGNGMMNRDANTVSCNSFCQTLCHRKEWFCCFRFQSYHAYYFCHL